ncbi:hypothetical protein NP493_1344g00004 [Ridgeia piscesae]|uniref:Uncharacterized protein n=1 Tax=Ridgeia piscesae TaxID=27915 RepID=A0AAD9NG68_RIDPI|nr:hypothetical protein NP493_1344g00004 [Ridgeia piscesae]
MVFCRGEFPEYYVPTIFENYVSELQVGNQTVQLALWDTAGQEDYDRLRPLSYPDTDVLLLCFAVDNPDSFENVADKWAGELAAFCPKTPVVLVGTKTDLRGDRGAVKNLQARYLEPVSKLDGAHLAARIRAHAYVECSAKTGEGVDGVFEVAAKAALRHKMAPRRRRMCWLL